MSKQEILEKVIEIVEEIMEVEDVTEDTHMQEDLEIESMNFYELLGRLEDDFHIRMPEKVLAEVDTVQDIAEEVERILNK